MMVSESGESSHSPPVAYRCVDIFSFLMIILSEHDRNGFREDLDDDCNYFRPSSQEPNKCKFQAYALS